MSKKRILCIILAAVNLLCFSMICVFATPEEEVISDATVVVTPTTVPMVTVPEPSVSQSQTPDVSTVVDPSASTYPSASEEPSSVPVSSSDIISSEVTTVVPSTPRPTEYQEKPSIDFNIQTPQLIRPDDNKDNSAKDWEDIDENEIIKEGNEDGDDIKLSVKDDGSGGGFGFDKGSVSVKDEKDPLFFIISIVCWFIALGLLTLAILLRPSQKALAGGEADSDKEKKTAKKSKGGKYAKKK